MLEGVNLRDDRYFYVPSPVLQPATPRRVEYLTSASIVEELSNGVLLRAVTVTGSPVTLQVRLVGTAGAVHVLTRSDGVAAAPRLPLARELPEPQVRIEQERHELRLVGPSATVRIELEPVRVSIVAGALVLTEDRSTQDASDQLVTLPLGFMRLASGTIAYLESYVAEPDEHFYGLGERFTNFDKRGQLVSCWNHDALGCLSEQSYKNVPFFVSSRGYGVFVDTTTNVHFDLCHSSQATWSLVVPDEQLSYYVVLGEPASCLSQYQELVGGPELPPPWALGSWISSGFTPYAATDVRNMVEELDAQDIPCDVINFDCYWQRFGSWSDLQWNADCFPDPASLLGDLASAGVKTCLWINPYIGIESPFFQLAEEAGYFLRRPDGSAWVGALWGAFHPNVAVIDVTNPAALNWWKARLKERVAEGVVAFKTDFGEAIPTDVVAHDGMSGDRLHNAYSLIYNDAAAEALREAGVRAPMLWGRSTWAGGQRHVAQWGGDPNSSWQDLASTLRAGLSMAMSGHAFWSHDIGGFHGTPTPELFVRWAQFGLLSPLSRFHGNSSRRPWDFGEEALTAVREVAKLRSALHPYLYGAARESVTTGAPILRPMVYAFPELCEAIGADLQYLLGPDLLVAPIYREGGRRPVWFPPGVWLPYKGGPSVVGPGWHNVELALDTAPLWLRAGASILMTSSRNRVGEAKYADLNLLFVGELDQLEPTSLSLIGFKDPAVRVERGTSGALSVQVADSLPPLSLQVLGAPGSMAAAAAQLNGASVTISEIASLCPLPRSR